MKTEPGFSGGCWHIGGHLGSTVEEIADDNEFEGLGLMDGPVCRIASDIVYIGPL